MFSKRFRTYLGQRLKIDNLIVADFTNERYKLKNEDASTLNYGRALFIDDEEQEEAMKFIPYKRPSEELLEFINENME